MNVLVTRLRRLRGSTEAELGPDLAVSAAAPGRREVLLRVRRLVLGLLVAAALLGAATGRIIREPDFHIGSALFVLVTIGVVVTIAHRVGARVENVFDRQDRLLRAAVHELYSPLGWVQAAVDEGLTGTSSEQDALTDAAGAVEDLRLLISDLVEAAQIISGAERLPAEHIDLAGIAEEVAARGTDTPAVVEARVDGGFRSVSGSPSLMRRAISNLVRNAARHGYGGGPGAITICVDQRGISVIDEGIGVPRVQLQRLRRAMPLGISIEPDGARLGLALVGWVAAVHGGELILEPNTPRGFRATIALSDTPGG